MLEMFQNADKSQKDEDAFYEMYNKILYVAQRGFLPAQDYLGYLYKLGLGDFIPAKPAHTVLPEVHALAHDDEALLLITGGKLEVLCFQVQTDRIFLSIQFLCLLNYFRLIRGSMIL